MSILYDGIKSIKQAEENVGGLSSPSKMPTYGWSISAFDCGVGSILVTQEGSACFECYARKGRYTFPNVQNALKRRLQKWKEDRALWRVSMIYLMNNKKGIVKSGCFRWFDSGDLQGITMLADIVEIALETPHIKHWLPTKEYQLVKDSKSYGFCPDIPSNLILRVSHPKVGKVFNALDVACGNSPRHNSAIFEPHNFGENYQGVDRLGNPITRYVFCPSSLQDNSCEDCRACWDSRIETVVYKAH